MKQNLYHLKTMKFYYKLFFVAVVCFCYNSCKNETVQIEKTRLIPFSQSNEVDEKGIVRDSSVNYFPECIFIDTVDYFVGENGQLFNTLNISKSRYSKISSTPIEELRDTSIIIIDTTTMHFSEESYLLYKIGEPSLSNHYLGKKIYRIIALRSFDNCLIIRIENDEEKIHVYSKEVKIKNYFKTIVSKTNFQHLSIGRDSINVGDTIYSDFGAYSYSSYNLLFSKEHILNPSLWTDFEALIDSSGFWKAKPQLYLNYVQVDGSMWILEGHAKEGYQIRRIPNPFNYNNCSYNRQNDDNKANYARIFQKLIEYSNFTDFKFY